MSDKTWENYEEVARYLLDELATHFGVSKFEGKQKLSGESGTDWEIDAKGCQEEGTNIVVVECKRHTKSGISQTITAGLAWSIKDLGADGGILVSPLGLQKGAKKVAASSNITEVILNPTSTKVDYMLGFLNQIHIGFSEHVVLSESYYAEARDSSGNLIG
jgi:hypothetical protein